MSSENMVDKVGSGDEIAEGGPCLSMFVNTGLALCQDNVTE